MKHKTLTLFLSSALVASLAVAPLGALAKSDGNGHAKATVKVNREEGCLKAFGHLVAPGWSKHNGTTTVSAHCRLPFGIAKKFGGKGNSSHGTTTPDTTAPSIFVWATRTGTSTAMVRWFTTERADSQVTYGTTTAYGSMTPLDTKLEFFHSVTITGLTPSTLYHFQVKSKDAAGNLGTSSDETLKTKTLSDTTSPILSGIGVSGVSSTSATVSWTTDEPATSKVYFASGVSLDLGTASTSSNSALVTNHSLVIGGLSASTTYSYAVQSQDAAANATTSATHSFISGL